MRKLEEIKSEMNALYSVNRKELFKSLGEDQKKYDKELKKMGMRVKFLGLCKMYLETNPTEEFVTSEIVRMQRSIEIFEERFSMWKINNKDTVLKVNDPYAYYRKINDYKGINEKIKTLKYLLG